MSLEYRWAFSNRNNFQLCWIILDRQLSSVNKAYEKFSSLALSI